MHVFERSPVVNYHALMGAWFLFGCLILLMEGYEGSFILLNGHHNATFDTILPHLTHLGDSLILCGLAAIIWARRFPWAILITVLAVTVAGLTAQLLKRTLFQEWDRPLAALGEAAVHLAGKERLYYNSFPSGHATAALAGVTALALTVVKRSRYTLLLGLLGIVVAYSRMYIGAHFFGDVMAGSLLGYLTATGFARLFGKRWASWFTGGSEKRIRTWGMVLTVLGVVALAWGIWKRYFL